MKQRIVQFNLKMPEDLREMLAIYSAQEVIQGRMRRSSSTSLAVRILEAFFENIRFTVTTGVPPEYFNVREDIKNGQD
jgi:hypothetical protein